MSCTKVDNELAALTGAEFIRHQTLTNVGRRVLTFIFKMEGNSFKINISWHLKLNYLRKKLFVKVFKMIENAAFD